MAIRFKKYKAKGPGNDGLYAIRITEANIDEIAEYIKKNGGSAFVTSGDEGKPRRLRIKQLNFGVNWSKRDWRVAVVGDFISRRVVESWGRKAHPKKFEFWRVKEDVFEATYHLV